jgi:predicted nucleotidyltransferase
VYFSDDMRELVQLFQKHDVEFAVCGGFAVAHYGFVRMTMDFDLLVSPSVENACRIMTALTEFGFGDAGFSERDFLNPGVAVTLGEQPNQIDLLTSMSSYPAADIIDRANQAELEGLRLKVVAYDDLLAAKREAGRAKDRIDAEELERLRAQAEGAGN